MLTRSLDVHAGSSVLVGLDNAPSDAVVSHAESLYKAGRVREALAVCEHNGSPTTTVGSLIRLNILRGVALFDLGECVQGVNQLVEADIASRSSDHALQFAAAFALFVRQADFQAPDEALLPLSRLRQLASVAGDAQSLAGLHFAVARVEGYRGLAADAHRHLEIARRFAVRARQEPLQCTLDVVGVS